MSPAALAASLGWAVAMARLARLPLSPIERTGILSFAQSCCLIALATTLPFMCRPQNEAAGRAAALGMLVATGIVDCRMGYIFDAATLPTAVVVLAVAIVTGAVAPALHAFFVVELPIGVLAAWSRGTWIGWGDVKAILSIVIAFGVAESLLALILASIAGIAEAHATKSRSVPFGPHLAFGALAAAILGPMIDPMFVEVG
jgi:prepilin signal peptidase PulO-like enzyme (type II secretory pathway)